jgi:HEAT repeat protein
MVEDQTQNKSQKPSRYLRLETFAAPLIPLAIVMGAILIIWGINTLLTTEKNYRDLVEELQTKTFGNRWVAAYELSKYLNSHAFPEAEKPWLIERLVQIYQTTPDEKTKSFIILAMGSLKDRRTVSFLVHVLSQPLSGQELSEEEKNRVFHALVSVGHLPTLLKEESSSLEKAIIPFFVHPDPGVRQVAIYTIVHLNSSDHVTSLIPILKDSEAEVRYAAATALALSHEDQAISTLKDLLQKLFVVDPSSNQQQKNEKHYSLQLNALVALEKSKWSVFLPEIDSLSKKSPSSAVKLKAQEVYLKITN